MFKIINLNKNYFWLLFCTYKYITQFFKGKNQKPKTIQQVISNTTQKA